MKLQTAALPTVFAGLLSIALWANTKTLQPAPPVAPLQTGVFPSQWIHGSDCGNEPDFQVHAYNPDLYILRQSPCVDFEAPFLYLIFGTDKVLLLDTGSSPDPDLEPVVSQIINDWLVLNGQGSIELVVAHSHFHADHVLNDDEFMNRPNTTFVPPDFDSVVAFWGFQNWPLDAVTYDLGGRILDVLATPGHAGDCITLYDRDTQLMITGDTVYPGRLYVFGSQLSGQWDVFRDSITRMANFASVNPVSWMVGAHIEMTNTPRRDFAIATTYHPDEHPLELDVSLLFDLEQQLVATPQSRTIVFDDFIVTPTF